jgi:hypothetical protein
MDGYGVVGSVMLNDYTLVEAGTNMPSSAFDWLQSSLSFSM